MIFEAVCRYNCRLQGGSKISSEEIGALSCTNQIFLHAAQRLTTPPSYPVAVQSIISSRCHFGRLTKTSTRPFYVLTLSSVRHACPCLMPKDCQISTSDKRRYWSLNNAYQQAFHGGHHRSLTGVTCNKVTSKVSRSAAGTLDDCSTSSRWMARTRRK
jgi:hypothetical protein